MLLHPIFFHSFGCMCQTIFVLLIPWVYCFDLKYYAAMIVGLTFQKIASRYILLMQSFIRFVWTYLVFPNIRIIFPYLPSSSERQVCDPPWPKRWYNWSLACLLYQSICWQFIVFRLPCHLRFSLLQTSKTLNLFFLYCNISFKVWELLVEFWGGRFEEIPSHSTLEFSPMMTTDG